MFPQPVPVPRVKCGHCRTHWVRVDRLVQGRYGQACAEELGLIPPTSRIRSAAHAGPDLLDHLKTQLEEEDHCDGHDR